MKQGIIGLTKKLISFDTSNPKGVNQSRRWLINWARKNNLPITTWGNNRSLLIKTNPNHKRHFSFVCHLDTVGAGHWPEAFKPKINNLSLTGRGAIDDKGPLAICLEVLKAARRENCNTSLLIVTDEETKNQDVIKVIKSGKFRPDFCLVADGGENNKFDIGQKGNLWLTVTVTTKGGHAAFADEGANAANVLSQFIWKLETWSQELPCHKPFSPAFINISQIEANTEPLNFTKTVGAKLQISFPPPQTATLWLKKIRPVKPVKIKVDWQSSSHLLRDKKWLQLIKKTQPHAKFITAGAPNLTHDLLLKQIPAVSHCPTRKYLAHCDNESIRLADLAHGEKLYVSLVKNFAKMR